MRQSIRLVYGSSEQGECRERGERNGGGTVPEMRLDAALMVLATESHPMLTRSRIQRAIEQGNICINGKSTTKPGKKVKSGDKDEKCVRIGRLALRIRAFCGRIEWK